MRRNPRTPAPQIALELLEARDVPATYAQGDIVVLGVGATTTDTLSVVTLKAMDPGDVISFTDNGFTAGAAGRTGEGFLSYTVPAGGHGVGTVLTWTNQMSITGTGWSSANPTNFAFNVLGDQLFVFTGPTANWATQSGIVLLSGVNFGAALVTSAPTASTTVQPTALTTAFLNLPTPTTHSNVYYSGNGSAAAAVSVVGTPATILADLTTPAKWFGAGNNVITIPPATTLVVTASPTNQTVSAGGTATFTAAASGNAAITVQWEESTNGGASYAPLTNGSGYAGVTTDTLTITGVVAGLNGNQYRAVYTNTAGSATTGAATLTVNTPVAVTVNPATLPNPVLQVPYSETVSGSGGTAPYTFDISAGSLPTGLTLGTNTGVLSGTPTEAGTYTFTVRATDGASNSGTRAYTLVVPLVVGPAGLPNGTRGVAYNQTITATGGTAPYSFAVTTGTLPGGLTLDANTGVISGTPDTPNTFNFTITATNGVGRSGSRAFTVVVAPSAGVSSIARVGGPNTNVSSVSWTVTFSHPVSNLTAANLTLLDVDTTLAGEGITGVEPTGAEPATVWTVTASTGNGDGRLRLNVSDPAGASPTLISLPTTVTTADFAVDKTAPTVVIGPPSAPLTSGGPVTFTVTYSGADSVTLVPGNVVLNATGGVTASVGVTGTGNTRTVTLSGITGNGTLGISLPANTASDLAGNPAAAAPTSPGTRSRRRSPPASCSPSTAPPPPSRSGRRPRRSRPAARCRSSSRTPTPTSSRSPCCLVR